MKPKRVSGPSGLSPKWKGVLSELVGFAALDVREIGRLREALWQEHTTANQELVLEAAALTPSKGRCVVVGAGPCYDIPLVALAEQFDEVALYDLNPSSLAQATASLPPELAAKVTCHAVELTHALPKALYGIKQEFIKAGSRAQRAANRAVSTLNQVRVGSGGLASLEGDLIISDMIVSQLPTSLWLVDEWYTELFRSDIMAVPQWVQAMSDFKEKLQNAHIDALLEKKGATVVLATDFGVGNAEDEANLDVLNELGRLTLAASTIYKINELQAEAVLNKSWVWHRDDEPPKYSPVWGVVFQPK